MRKAKYISKNLKNVRFGKPVTTRLTNRCVACFNLAVTAIKLENTIDMLNQVKELEMYLEPHMSVYKNIILTGLSSIMFKPNFIQMAQILEEFLCVAVSGESPLMLSENELKGKTKSSQDFGSWKEGKTQSQLSQKTHLQRLRKEEEAGYLQTDLELQLPKSR